MRVRVCEHAGFSARAGFLKVKEYTLRVPTHTAICRASLRVFLRAGHLAPLSKVDSRSTFYRNSLPVFVHEQSFQRRHFPVIFITLCDYLVTWEVFKDLISNKRLFHLPISNPLSAVTRHHEHCVHCCGVKWSGWTETPHLKETNKRSLSPA